MIIDQLVLHDFGVYAGHHEIELTPASAKKPIVLIGGLNGGGKTSILDALQLVLYGKRAVPSNRGGQSYDSYLRGCINSSALPSEGSSLELVFRRRAHGEEERYCVHRSWRDTGSVIRERVQIWRNGTLDGVLTDNWDERVEEFLPARLASLFFFDGEKIEALADLGQSRELLRVAVHKLLGLDRVEQLAADLRIVERRKRAELGDGSGELEALQQAEGVVEAVTESISDARLEIGSLRNQVERARGELARVESSLRNEGGDLYQGREALEAKRGTTERELAILREQLVLLAGGAPPLMICRTLLRRVAKQAAQESESERARLLHGVLEQRDQDTHSTLVELGVSDEVMGQVQARWDAELATLEAKGGTRSYLSMSPADALSVERLLSQGLKGERSAAMRLIKRVSELEGGLADLERSLEAVPRREQISALLESRGAARAELAQLESTLVKQEEGLERLLRDLDRAVSKRDRLQDAKVRADFGNEDAQRMVEHSQRVRKTLAKFRETVAREHLRRIAKLALESFQHLLHKKGLISGLEIDPDTYGVSLFGKNGKQLQPKRLSAGERQLLAISLLWGLARASGLSLPTIIDTPLGRLDSAHRTHLVKRYFPRVSHQVILLSTDEEIDERYYPLLSRWVGREYTLEHDSSSASTSVREGYFWAEGQPCS